ncbi:MAG TPA: flagellar protein FlgN [Nitrospiraceae bacterium]|nr:flagellar protein FlgN [Nitrospiraceae bacterium]
MPDSLPSSLLPELIDLLERIGDRIETFVTLLDAEETAIRAWSFEELSRINSAKHDRLEEIRRLEEHRAAVIEHIADAWHVPASALDLSDLAQRVESGGAARLRQLQSRLHKAAETAKEKNRYLAVLVARSLEFFRESMDIFRPSSNEIGLYSASGSRRTITVETGLVERRE